MVKLVRFGEEHLEATRRWLTNSAGLREQIDCLSAPTRFENEAYWRAKWQDAAREDYAIVDEAANHVGNCGLSEIDRQRKKAKLWIYLGDVYGQGLGRKAVCALLLRAFSELALERVGETNPIHFQPFEIERNGTKFGMIARAPEDASEGESWWVELEPGNYMAFYEPWDSGEYDT